MFRLTKSQFNRICRLTKQPRVHLSFKERIAIKVLEAVLGRPVLKQFKCGKYKIDAYDPITNTCYEFDEEHHKYQKFKDLKRQKFIEHKLKCTVARIAI